MSEGSTEATERNQHRGLLKPRDQLKGTQSHLCTTAQKGRGLQAGKGATSGLSEPALSPLSSIPRFNMIDFKLGPRPAGSVTPCPAPAPAQVRGVATPVLAKNWPSLVRWRRRSRSPGLIQSPRQLCLYLAAARVTERGPPVAASPWGLCSLAQDLDDLEVRWACTERKYNSEH